MPLRLVVKDQENFFKHVTYVCIGVCTLYIVFDFYMNLSWGDFAKIKVITDALPGTSWVTYTVKCIYTSSLFFTYPLQLTPAINLIEGWIFDKNSAPTKKRYWLQNSFRTVYVAFTIVLSTLTYKFIPTVIELNAAMCCAPIAFTLPVIYHYKLMEKNKCHLAMIIGTIILAVFLVTMIFVEMFKGE